MMPAQPSIQVSLPPPFNSHSVHDQSKTPTLLTQGAEALVFRTTFLTPSTPCALKYRPSKPYRHPILDKGLTRQRILAEARVLVRCRKEGVRVPAVLAADWEAGWLLLEWIPGWTIRRCLDAFLTPEDTESPSHRNDDNPRAAELKDLMRRIGLTVAHLHSIGVIHGDLTTNQQLPTSLAGTITLIDFGLAVQTTQDEDKAVDLYVLERAFAATHPAAEELFRGVLEAYGGAYNGGRQALKRLEDVRLRGRKRSMIG
ncbi:kinase-like protein [Viridothelium virens]|uniref:non-specific serine/threonine protein kinase n=1 Tax=Viridothelium virens TaxID=1048519 RepID=A0A6A6HKX5_VIRVR|nr:kinase-like protein [Viridothelium virens]